MAEEILTLALRIDSRKIDQDAFVEKETILFRLAAPLYSSLSDLLNGKGALAGDGRYHRVHQFTSYVSDNILLCFAEILYHMSRKAMAHLAGNGLPAGWQNCAQIQRHLVIFEVNEIRDLIYIDTKDCRQEILRNASQAIPSTIIVHPDWLYEPLHRAADYCRSQRKNGVVYPSARYPQGLAVGLFLDHTASIKNISATVKVTLSLIEGNTGKPAIPPYFDPDVQKISHMRGHYEFDPTDFASAGASGLLNPRTVTQNGFVEFVRRN